MSVKRVSNVIDFQAAKERAESLRKSRRIEEIRNRFERAMGWERQIVPKSKRQEKVPKRQRR